jgi:branched-chain amino acid transport system substrate-binding protein
MKYFLYILLVAILFLGCTKKNDETKIALVVGLSGKYSSLGNDIKDGVELAFDEINYTINGKKIDLFFCDDKQDAKVDKKIIHQLLNDNIKVIIGNATSSMTKISLDIINKQKGVLLFSPTASSAEFSNKDDNFIRINGGDIKDLLGDIARFLKDNNLENITIIGDEKNQSYLSSYSKILPQYLTKLDIPNNINFISSNLPLSTIKKKLKTYNKTDIILLVANATDSAQLVQYLRVHDVNLPMICTGWAKNSSFFENAGKYAQGVYFTSSVEETKSTNGFTQFANSFKKTYKKEPGKFNIKGYKVAKILIEALRQTDDISKLKQTILKIKSFDTINEVIVFNKYGDIQHKEKMQVVKNNKLEKVY